ncbi:MAG: hypothetical protein Q8S31_04535 [Alphaproteobacteria bacterium]|nr:hypothetical protein [Alphaproteobacteria bacterium]
MKRLIIILISLCAWSKGHANPVYKNLFTKEIYDQSDLLKEADPTTKVEHLVAKKTAIIQRKLIEPNSHEIKKLTPLYNTAQQKREIMNLSYPIVTTTHYIPTAWFVSSLFNKTMLFLYAETIGYKLVNPLFLFIKSNNKSEYFWNMYSEQVKSVKDTCTSLIKPITDYNKNRIHFLNCHIPIKDIETKISDLKKQNETALENIYKGPLFEIEIEYVIHKSRLSVEWQEKIESLLINSYNQDSLIPAEKAKNLIQHPYVTGIFCEDFDSLREELNHIEARIEEDANIADLSIEIMQITDGLTKSAFHLDSKEVGVPTRKLYYIHNDSKVIECLPYIAENLGLSSLIVNAKNIPANKAEALLFGTKSKIGFILDLLQNQVQPFQNVILIIKDFDTWAIDDNMGWIKDHFENVPVPFHSPFFDLDILCPGLSIICTGDTKHENLDSKLVSRFEKI